MGHIAYQCAPPLVSQSVGVCGCPCFLCWCCWLPPTIGEGCFALEPGSVSTSTNAGRYILNSADSPAQSNTPSSIVQVISSPQDWISRSSCSSCFRVTGLPPHRKAWIWSSRSSRGVGFRLSNKQRITACPSVSLAILDGSFL